MISLSDSRFFETNCYFKDMSQYEKALAWIKAKAKSLPGGKADIRQDRGGDRPYIAKAGESAATEMSKRNAAILRDHRAGERATYLARKYGISRKRVHEIVREGTR